MNFPGIPNRIEFNRISLISFVFVFEFGMIEPNSLKSFKCNKKVFGIRKKQRNIEKVRTHVKFGLVRTISKESSRVSPYLKLN